MRNTFDRHRGRWFFLFLVLLSAALGIGAASASRPTNWAQPVVTPDVPNLFQVSPTLYRSAQPGAAGMRELKKLGIKTVVNLRSFHSDADILADTGLAVEAIPTTAWGLTEADAVRFLKIAVDTAKTPILVHCQHGADRTGALVAVYRLAVQGWTKEEAIREMTDGGYGFHAVWANLIVWIKELDVERLRREAGLAAISAS
ncbi:MAG: dual specificity protein phosphatase family protein [Myxococcales bacterium]|nr:dual specificity protein phosphatase family protein [Myxococcales bacterium]